MANKNTLPEGDFTESDFWPRMVYGQPRETEILDAQNQVLAKHLIQEQEKRNKHEAFVQGELTAHKGLLKAIGEKLGIDPETIATLSPTKVSPWKVRDHADKTTVEELGKEFHDRIYIATSSFAPDRLRVNNTAATAAFVKSWYTDLEVLLEPNDYATLTGLNEAQKMLTYLKATKALAKAKKAAEAEKAGEAAVDEHEEAVTTADEAVADSLDPVLMDGLTTFTRDFMRDNAEAIVYTDDDKAASREAIEIWMVALKDSALEEGDLLVLEGMTLPQQKAVYFRLTTNIRAQITTTDASSPVGSLDESLFADATIASMPRPFVNALWAVHKPWVDQNRKIALQSKTANFDSALDKWTQAVAKTSLPKVTQGDGEDVEEIDGAAWIGNMDASKRGSIFLKLNKAAKAKTGAVPTIKPPAPRSSRSKSPAKAKNPMDTRPALAPGTVGRGALGGDDLGGPALVGASRVRNTRGGRKGVGNVRDLDELDAEIENNPDSDDDDEGEDDFVPGAED